MSVINQMLKDLEKRSSHSSNPSIILSGLTVRHIKSYKKNGYLIILFFSFIAFMIVIQLYFLKKPTELVPSSQKGLANPHHELLKKNSEKSLVENLTETILLTGIAFQAEKGVTHLRFLLAKPTLYRLIHHKNGELIIVLDHAKLVSSLPHIDTTRSGIKNIKMLAQKDGLRIVLTLEKNAQLSHVELDEKAKFPELEMDFIYDPSTDNVFDEENSIDGTDKSSVKKLSYDTSIQEEYKQALEYSVLGQDEEAIQLLTTLLKNNPDYPPARELLASLLLTEGDTENAQHIITVGLQQRPFYPSYVLVAGRILIEQGNLVAALHLLKHSPPLMKKNPEYHAFMAALYQRDDKFGLSEKIYEKLLRLDPNHATWWVGLGIAQESLNKNREALKAYENAKNTEGLSTELRQYIDTRIHRLL